MIDTAEDILNIVQSKPILSRLLANFTLAAVVEEPIHASLMQLKVGCRYLHEVG